MHKIHIDRTHEKYCIENFFVTMYTQLKGTNYPLSKYFLIWRNELWVMDLHRK